MLPFEAIFRKLLGKPEPEPLNTPEFHEERKTSLIVLLQKHPAPYATECITDIRRGKLLPPYRFAAPIEEIRDKYEKSLKLKSEMDSPIFGYEDLLANLKKPYGNAVNIHLVEGENYTFDIVTDPASEHLYGLVAFDESTEWRGYPRPRLQDHCDWDINEPVNLRDFQIHKRRMEEEDRKFGEEKKRSLLRHDG